MTPRQLARQARSRNLIRGAVRRYANLRTATGAHRDSVAVQLADGTHVIALINIDLVPDPLAPKEPTP